MRAGDDFREAAKAYLKLMLGKGVPSTFANLKHLYSDSTKQTVLRDLAEEYLESLKSSANGDQANGDSSRGQGAALFFLAQHYNYFRSRDLKVAMEFVDKAIALDKDNVDFSMTKARIWKHYGDAQKAAQEMDHARSLDTRDRYINSKAAKYQLRNNDNEKALQLMGLFTRAETVGGPLADLLDMQCMWFLTEDGEAYARRGNVGLALKRFHSIFNIFDVWQEDQFDFHSFSLRKGQIRAYIDMVRWEDRLREHPFYTRAALDAIKIYLDMYDASQASATTNGANGVNGASDGKAGDDAAERKKAAKKAKKEAQKAEREAAEKAAKVDPNKGAKKKDEDKEGVKKKDDDPDGAKLAATTDPLGDAMKFLEPLLQFTARNVAVQTVGFEVFIRRSKSPLAWFCELVDNPDFYWQKSTPLRSAA
jgi:N-alpha-acetyltransferase 15/16, NatA auxiliary subunit